MKKSIMYSSLLAVSSIYFAGCSERVPNSSGAQVSSTKALAYIMRDSLDNRASSVGTQIEPLADHLAPSHVRGARIYDDFMIELASDTTVAMPAGDNPLLAMATPIKDGAPTGGMASWLCSGCHGYDYEGGIFEFGNSATNNLLELREVRGRDEAFVYHMLMTGFSAWDGTQVVNVHNYSGILTEQAMTDVADFVVNEIFDTHQYIRAPSSGGLGDHSVGSEIYNSVATGAIPPLIRVDGSNFNCVDCHGADGLGVADIDLYALAWSNPFRWLHRVNFGSPRDLGTFPDISVEDGTVHPGLYEVILTDGLHFGGPEQASDLLAFSQESGPGHLRP